MRQAEVCCYTLCSHIPPLQASRRSLAVRKAIVPTIRPAALGFATLAHTGGSGACGTGAAGKPLTTHTAAAAGSSAGGQAGGSWFGQRPWIHSKGSAADPHPCSDSSNSSSDSHAAHPEGPKLGRLLEARVPSDGVGSAAADPFCFSLMSYNILGDCYAQQYVSKLYRSVPRQVLQWSHRRPLLAKEILFWSPDVVALQEVEHYKDVEQDLRAGGYEGVFVQRGGGRRDGCATFWKPSRLRLRAVHPINFGALSLDDNVALILELEPLPPTVGNVLSLVPPGGSNGGGRDGSTSGVAAANAALPAAAAPAQTTGHPPPLMPSLLVSNTHLVFDPSRGDVKTGQIRTLLGHLGAIIAAGAPAPAPPGTIAADAAAELCKAAAAAAARAATLAAAAAGGGGGAGAAIASFGRRSSSSGRRSMELPAPPAAAARPGGVVSIVAGDFNTLPDSPLYRFCLDGRLDVLQHSRKRVSGQLSAATRSSLEAHRAAAATPAVVPPSAAGGGAPALLRPSISLPPPERRPPVLDPTRSCDPYASQPPPAAVAALPTALSPGPPNAPPAAAAAAAEVGAAADNGKGGPLGGAGDSPSNGVKAAGGEAGVVEAPAQGSEGGAALAAVSAAPCSPPWTASARVPAALADERPAVTEYAPPSTTTNTTSPPPPPAAHASGGVASSALQAAAALSPAQTTGRVAGGAGGAGVGASPPPPPPLSSPSPRVSTDMSRGALAATHCAAGLPPPPSHGVLDSLLRGVQSAMSLVDGNGWTRRHLRSAMGDQALEAVGAAASASGGKEVQLLVTHPLQLISSYAQVAGSEPPFTSSHDCFHNTCDYIFFTPAPSGVAAPAAAAGLSASASAPGQPRQPAQPQLVPLSVLAVPPASAVPGGMPAAQWGSDHIALITTFELRTSQQL